MEILGICVLLSMVLYLIDKNQKWKVFWRLVGACAVLVVLVISGFFIREVLEHRRVATMTNAQTSTAKFDPSQPYVDYDALARRYGAVKVDCYDSHGKLIVDEGAPGWVQVGCAPGQTAKPHQPDWFEQNAPKP